MSVAIRVGGTEDSEESISKRRGEDIVVLQMECVKRTAPGFEIGDS